MSLEDRVLALEAQVEVEKRRTDRVLLRLTEANNKLHVLEKRIAGLTDEVGHVLEARECESDSGRWSSISDDVEGTTLSDDSSLSEEIPAVPIRLSKLVKPHYEPVPTKKLVSAAATSTTSAGTSTKKSKGAKKSTSAVVVALTKKFKPPAKVTAGGGITIKKRKTQE